MQKDRNATVVAPALSVPTTRSVINLHTSTAHTKQRMKALTFKRRSYPPPNSCGQQAAICIDCATTRTPDTYTPINTQETTMQELCVCVCVYVLRVIARDE